MKFLNPVFLSQFQNKYVRFFNQLINGCYINTKLPMSTKLVHRGLGVVIGYGVKLGENVRIYQNTTIGGKKMINDGDDYPTIKDNVKIGANCVIIGAITIGENVQIGACSFINKDIPANSIAYNPRKIEIRKCETAEATG